VADTHVRTANSSCPFEGNLAPLKGTCESKPTTSKMTLIHNSAFKLEGKGTIYTMGILVRRQRREKRYHYQIRLMKILIFVLRELLPYEYR
jgi:hypothetical protein